MKKIEFPGDLPLPGATASWVKHRSHRQRLVRQLPASDSSEFLKGILSQQNFLDSIWLQESGSLCLFLTRLIVFHCRRVALTDRIYYSYSCHCFELVKQDVFSISYFTEIVEFFFKIPFLSLFPQSCLSTIRSQDFISFHFFLRLTHSPRASLSPSPFLCHHSPFISHPYLILNSDSLVIQWNQILPSKVLLGIKYALFLQFGQPR